MCEYCTACCVCIRLNNVNNPSPSDIIHRIDNRDCECKSCDNSFCEYHWKIELSHVNTEADKPYLIAKCMDCKDEEQQQKQKH